MNKSEFIDLLSQKSNISKTRCAQFLEDFKSTILQVCCQGEDVCIRNFGKFSLSERRARKYLNPQTKRYYICPPKKMITFKGYKNFIYKIS